MTHRFLDWSKYLLVAWCASIVGFNGGAREALLERQLIQ